MECESHFCFVKQLLHVLSFSCVARYKIIYMEMQVRFLLLVLYYLEDSLGEKKGGECGGSCILWYSKNLFLNMAVNCS